MPRSSCGRSCRGQGASEAGSSGGSEASRGPDQRRHLPRDRRFRNGESGHGREGENDVPVQAVGAGVELDDRSVDTAGSVTEGVAGKPACTLEMADGDFLAMATGQADAMKLFSTGKLKISGDVMASQKLGFLKKSHPGDGAAETTRRTGGAARGSGDRGRRVEPTVAEVLAVIDDHLSPIPSRRKDRVIYQWRSAARVGARCQNGAAASAGERGGHGARDRERDFLDMTSGKADAMKLSRPASSRSRAT